MLWSAAHSVDRSMQYASGAWLDMFESLSIPLLRNRANITRRHFWIPLSRQEAWAQAAAGVQTDHMASKSPIPMF